MSSHLTRLPVEQAVYGSFPFWDRGYALLARSPGCRDEWVDEFQAACERFGERPREVSATGGLLVFRLASGPWAVVGVSEAGYDDRGRPGALAFHAFFVHSRDYRQLDGWPFGLARFHRRTWGEEIRELESLVLEVEGETRPAAEDPRAARIARALGRGQRVAIESESPIDGLAREVWARLPSRLRQKRSLATWAFGIANRFDLVGLPERSAVDLDGSYVRPEEIGPVAEKGGTSEGLRVAGASLVAGQDSEVSAPKPLENLLTTLRAGRCWPWVVAVLVLAAGLVLFGRSIGSNESIREIELTVDREVEPIPRPPDRELFRDDPLAEDPEMQRRVRTGLIELAERFNLIEPSGGEADNWAATTLMERIARDLRYRGPLLTLEERDRLQSEPAAGRSRALAWDEHIRRFLPDRLLPTDFAQGPLRWQLETLAWSFHLSPDPRPAPAEWPHALSHALAVEGSVKSNPIAEKYPALREYERFLRRLPRR